MRGYVTIDSSDAGKISVESRTEVYRDPERGEQIVAETDGNAVPLGVADVTVSRKKGSTAPVVLNPREKRIEIHNNGNSNGVTVDSEGTEREVAEGRIETVSNDATITIGYQTTLRLTTERGAKIVNEGSGTVVMGDDRSTHVTDSVVNRSDIGGDAPAVVDDSVVNRPAAGSEANPSKTNSVGGRAPDSESRPGPEHGRASSTDTQDMQFCINCGTEIRATALYCPHCGYDLSPDQVPETGTETTTSETDTQQFCQEHELAYDGDACPKCAGAGPN